jgi:hypothetical protein
MTVPSLKNGMTALTLASRERTRRLTMLTAP